MSVNLQIISFLISFIFGILFYYITFWNFQLIAKMRVIIKHILTFIYVLDMTIIYIIIIYNINKGYFHIYFILTVFLGFVIGGLIHKKFLSKIDVKKIFKN